MGTPQGAVISPLLSNIYLDPLDHLMAREGFEMVRYADDFVVLCRSPEGCGPWPWTRARLDGDSRPDPASDEDANRRRDGPKALTSWVSFRPAVTLPARQSLKKLKDTIRAKTKRNFRVMSCQAS